MRVLLFFVIGIPLAFAATIFLASELGGEVVTLHTADGGTTSLWIVEKDGHSYLRAGDSESGWYATLQRSPEVEVERGGSRQAYRATPVPRLTSNIDALMARDYGMADRLVSMVRDPSKSIAIRLVPIE